jgi:PIN domain nuclease of toxin-antitoxin system
MTTVVLDTHALVWWSSQPERVSAAAARSIEDASELAISDISWFEIAWLVQGARIEGVRRLDRWMAALSDEVRSVPISPQIATVAAALPAAFPRDPADRIIYATALENGWPLVTKDERIRAYRADQLTMIW